MEVRSTARKGRQLEELIAILERSISGTGIIIKSPDYIKDKVTGDEREVDISLRAVVGSHEILIILECRDHKSRQDVTWIEPLANKKDDIEANKAIAVSSSGFTSGAVAKARARSIELRTLEDIKPEEVLGWFRGEAIYLISRKFTVKRVMFHYNPTQIGSEKISKLQTCINSRGENFRPEQQQFLIDGSCEILSLNQIVESVIDELTQSVTLNKEKIESTFLVQGDEHGGGISIVIDETPVELKYIQVTADIWVEEAAASIQSIKAYKNDDNAFAHIIRFESLNFPDGERIVEMHRIPKGDM